MLYVDDGVSFDFKQGKFLRMESSCSVEDNTLHVRVGPHQGDFSAWWSQITIEVYGWAVPGAHAKLAGEDVKGTWNSTINAWQTTIPDSGKGLDLTLEQ
jgi:alpha-glucosidase